VNNEDDEDYEEGFDEAVNDEGGDEMERLKLAMAKEKAKAHKYVSSNQNSAVKPKEKHHNPLSFKANVNKQ
jgi:hypothetical protein